MPTLKLPNVASIYGGKPYNLDKLVRMITCSPFTVAGPAPVSARTTNCSAVWRRGWRISPCAPVASPVYDKLASSPYKKLGLRGQRYFCSIEDRSKTLGGGREHSVGNLVTEMGAAGKDDQWFESDVSSTLPLTPHGHREKPKPPPSQQNQHSDKLLTLPTILTLGRVAAVPLFVCTFYVDRWWAPTATTGIFIAAAVTDWLDGYLARKMNLGTAFGAFLDPVADKLMVAATLVLLCTRPFDVAVLGQLPWLLTVPAIAIIGREITMSAVREWAASQNSKLLEAVAVNNLGKWKTATQMIALTILLAARDNSLTGAVALVASGVVLLYISAWLAVWSLFVYMRKIWKVLLM